METPSAAVGARAPWERHGWLALAALPLLLLACNPSWILTYPGSIDSWVYYGYFTNFSTLWREFPDVYYGTRLSWLLPGAMAHDIMPPRLANTVLHLGVFYITVFATYVTVARAYGSRTALFVAVLLGSYSHFLVSAGWHYVDGIGIAYYAATVALLIRPTRADMAWWMPLAAGATYAAAIHSNLVWGLFLPIVWFTYLRLPAADARQKYLHAACFLAGALLLTAGLGLEAQRRGAPFLFFMPSLRFASATALDRDTFAPADPFWMLSAHFLVVPTVAAVAVLIARIRMSGEDRRFDRVLLDHFLIWAGAFLLLLALGRPFLKLPSYTSLLIPSLFLALAPMLWPRVRQLSASAFAVVLATALMIPGLLLLPLAGIHLHGLGPPLVVAVPALVLAAGIAWLAIRNGPAAIILFVVCFGVANVMVTSRVFRFERLGERGDAYDAIVQADRMLATHDEGGRFWYDRSSPLGDVFQAVASTRLWAYRLIGDKFPTLLNPLSRAETPVGAGDRIVVLGIDRDRTLAQADAALRAHGLDVVLTNDDRIEAGSVRFHMLSLRTGMKGPAIDATAAPVLIDVFAKGQRAAAQAVEIDVPSDRIRVVTNRSAYDWQQVSVPIPVVRHRRYVVEFEVAVLEGGAGLNVVNPAANNAVLVSKYWCKPTPRHTQSLTFDAGESDSVVVGLSNCGYPAPAVSTFTVDRFRLLRLQ